MEDAKGLLPHNIDIWDAIPLLNRLSVCIAVQQVDWRQCSSFYGTSFEQVSGSTTALFCTLDDTSLTIRFLSRRTLGNLVLKYQESGNHTKHTNTLTQKYRYIVFTYPYHSSSSRNSPQNTCVFSIKNHCCPGSFLYIQTYGSP